MCMKSLSEIAKKVKQYIFMVHPLSAVRFRETALSPYAKVSEKANFQGLNCGPRCRGANPLAHVKKYDKKGESRFLLSPPKTAGCYVMGRAVFRALFC